MEYLLTWQKDGVELVGPFEAGKAYEWATTVDVNNNYEAIDNPNNPHDTPCWQVIDLEIGVGQPSFAIAIRSPGSGPLKDYDPKVSS